MSGETWTIDQHYARGMADALGQAYVYLLRHGSEDMGAWLKRREQGFMALLPTDEHGNTQFAPANPTPTTETRESAGESES